jgi:hypothetical protein
VAVKVLRQDLAGDEEFLRRFRLEVSAARRVNGLYTAAVVASGLDGRPPWVATAFVPGPPLDRAVAQHGPLPEAALWRLLAGLAEALRDIHGCGLVHRDLKPGNVLLAADGPRVIDFGISRALDGTAMTSAGAVFGTPAFMAPEQAQGLDAGPASDVFALGGVLAYAATGAPPFGAGSAPAVLYRVVHGAPSVGGVPPLLRGVVARCLAKDPAARPSLDDLAAIGRDGPAGAAAPQSPASFWPPQVARLIRDHQDRLDGTVTASVPPVGSPAPQAHTWQAPQPQAPGAAAGMRLPPLPRPAPGPGLPGSVPPGQSSGRSSPRAGWTPWKTAPAPVRAAVIVMYLAAVLTSVPILIVVFATHQATPVSLLFLVAAALWLVIAEGTRRGRNWARVTGTVIFGICTLLSSALVYALMKSLTFLEITILALPWLFGLAVVLLIWRPSARRFFQPPQASSPPPRQ